jgi:hypothetical protein
MTDDELFQMALDILDGNRWLGDWREWEEMVRKRMAPKTDDRRALNNLEFEL